MARAVTEVARPVTFSVLVIAVILVPLYALQGIEGKMFAPLARTMLIALLVSLAVALHGDPGALRRRPARSRRRRSSASSAGSTPATCACSTASWPTRGAPS